MIDLTLEGGQIVDLEISSPSSPQGIQVDVAVEGNPGPQGPPGSVSAEGTQDILSQTWIMNHNLNGMPAAFRFFDGDGNEWEPEDVVYINENRTVAQWPEPMLGSWIAS